MRREIKQFVIDKDITSQEVERLTLKIAEWLRDPKCGRRSEDPVNEAKSIMQQCLDATTKDGDPWRNAPETLRNRVRIKAAFDIETGEGIPAPRVKAPHAVRALEKAARQNKAKLDDVNPYLAEFDIERFRQDQESSLLEAFPDLENPATLPHVRRLSLLYAQQEMIDRDLLMTANTNKRAGLLQTMETLNKTIDSLLKILDIHPESIRKKIKESAEGNLGELVAILDGDEFRERERIWSLQLALQLWSMTVRPNGRGDGPQITPWEFWHMTRSIPWSFTCQCGKHYPHLVSGFTPKGIKRMLLEKGVLITKSVYEPIIPSEAVKDLDVFIDSLPEDV
jgi:hypothetical protein